MQAMYRMISSKSSIIYSLFFMIVTLNLAIGFNFNRSESKVYSSLYRATNQDNTTNKSYKTFSNTNFNEIRNKSGHFTNHTESTVNKTDLQTERTVLKRICRRISSKNNASSHRNSHEDAHKLVDKSARKKTSRRYPKFHVHDSNRKNDTSKKQSDRKWEKQDGETSVLLNGIKIKNLAKTAPFEDNVKIPGSLTNNSYIAKKRIGKVHGVDKVKLNNLPRNDILNNKSGIKDENIKNKNSQDFVGTDFSFVKGGKHSSIKKVTAMKHSHELSMNQVYRKNKQRTNAHSSLKRISNIQKRIKEKGHKNFNNDVKKLNTLIGEAELHKNTLKNDDSLKLNNNRNRENAGEIPDRESFTSTSHGRLKMKENGLEDIKNSSESEILVKLKDVKDRLLKTHQKAKAYVRKKDYGNEKTFENSLKSMKVRRKARYLKNRRATLQQVKAHDALSRIQKHSHLKSLKRNTRNEMNLLYEMKDFIVNHFPKKRDEQEVESLQTRKNVHREARNTVDDNSDNSSRKNRSGITSYKAENGNSKTLEEMKDFVVKNFHIERKKRNPLVQQNLIPLSRSVRSSKDYESESSYGAIRSKNNVPGKFRPNSFMNAIKESDSLWGDLQGIVKRETEANSISEDVGNFTVSEYDYADDANVTEVITDTKSLIIKKDANVNSTSTFEITRQSEEENYKSDSDLVLDQYNENSPDLTTNEELPTENEGAATDLSTDVLSEETSITELNLESNADGKNDSNDQNNVSERTDSNSRPNDDRIPEITSKYLIEREISTVTNPLLVSTEMAQSSLSNTFSEMSDVTTFTSAPVTSTYSKSDSTTYENTTPLSTELTYTESKDIISVDSNTDWNSGSSLPSSTHTEAQETSDETSSVLLSTYSTSEESSFATSTNIVQTSLATRAPKVYRDVQHVKEVKDDYEDKTLSDESTSNTFEEQENSNTVGWLNRIQNISKLEGLDVNSKEKEYKMFTITESTSESLNKFDNIKHGGKSQRKHKNYDSQRLAGNMNKNAQKYRLNSVKDQKDESLSTIESENRYNEETVSEETGQVLRTTIDSGKGEYIRFGNVKEVHTNTKAHQKMKPHALSNEKHKFVNLDVHTQYDYDGKDVSKSIIQDLTPNNERSKAFTNPKGKRVNSNVILKGNYQSLGIEFNTLTNLGPNTLDNTKEESSTIKNRNHIPGSSKPAIQHKKVNNLGKIENSHENAYEFETDSNLQVSNETFVSNKVYRKPKDRKANLKSTQYIDESVDEDLDYLPKLIVLHLRKETAKAKSTPTSLRAVSEESWINLPEKETKNSKLNNQGENEDEYEDSTDEISYIPPTETLETTTKPRIPKEYKNRLQKGEKLPNHKFDVYSKSNKFQMTTFPDAQPFDDERLSQTDKQLEGTEIGMEEKETDKSVNEAISGQKLEENWTSKPTISPNEKLKSNLSNKELTLNLKKQEEEEQEETESTRKEVEKLPNHKHEIHSKTNKMYMTTLSDTQSFDDEIYSQTDKSLKEIGEEKTVDKSGNKAMSGPKREENLRKKSTISPIEKFTTGLKNVGLTLNLNDDEQEEIESTRKEVERDQTFSTYFVTLQNAKIMPDETTTYSTQSTYSDIPRAHESLIMNHESTMPDETTTYSTQSTYSDIPRPHESLIMNHESTMPDETTTYITQNTYSDIPRAHESLIMNHESTMSDYDPGVPETESVTEIPEPLQKNAESKRAGKDKEFVRLLNSLISHVKERRRKSHLQSMNHIISRRARAAVTSKPTPKPEVGQVRMPRGKEWWIGGAGIIIMGLFIIGMYHTVIKISKKKKVREKSTKNNDFHAVLHGYETEDEMEDLSDDVIFLQSFIDQVIQNHEISEDGSIKVDYSTAEHMSKIYAATTGTIDK